MSLFKEPSKSLYDVKLMPNSKQKTYTPISHYHAIPFDRLKRDSSFRENKDLNGDQDAYWSKADGVTFLSWNVHYQGDISKVSEVLRSNKPDVVLLQEINQERMKRLRLNLGKDFLPHRLLGKHCMILSTFKLKLQGKGVMQSNKRHDYLVASLKAHGQQMTVINLHLDSKEEEERLNEVIDFMGIQNIKSQQVWSGDFNSLYSQDYQQTEWRNLSDIFDDRQQESPMSHVYNFMSSQGFTDCWVELGKPGYVDTSIYGTRVDYIHYNKYMKRKWNCVNVRHLDWSCSDHRPVMATFCLKDEEEMKREVEKQRIEDRAERRREPEMDFSDKRTAEQVWQKLKDDVLRVEDFKSLDERERIKLDMVKLEKYELHRLELQEKEQMENRDLDNRDMENTTMEAESCKPSYSRKSITIGA